MKRFLPLIAFISIAFTSCAQTNSTDASTSTDAKTTEKKIKKEPTMSKNLDTITLGAGCFWCVEAVFQSLNGVEKVVSGYSGGHVVNPTYEQICEKETGHAEVCQVVWDTTVLSLDELLEVYWQTHDPTTLNQQGADKGPQYRSVIFYHNDTQKAIAQKYKTELNAIEAFDAPVVTAIEAYSNFYEAEAYHQNYYKTNPSAGYCYYVIRPKMDKFNKLFASKAKKE